MLGAVFNFNFTLQCMLMCPKILLIICKCLEMLRYLKEFQIGALVFEFFYGFRIWGKESMEYGNMIWAVTCHSAHRFCHQPRIGATHCRIWPWRYGGLRRYGKIGYSRPRKTLITFQVLPIFTLGNTPLALSVRCSVKQIMIKVCNVTEHVQKQLTARFLLFYCSIAGNIYSFGGTGRSMRTLWTGRTMNEHLQYLRAGAWLNMIYSFEGVRISNPLAKPYSGLTSTSDNIEKDVVTFSALRVMLNSSVKAR